MKLQYNWYSLGSGVKKVRTRLAITLTGVALLLSGGAAATAIVSSANAAPGGFDQYGYNRTARVFVGTCETWAQAKGWPQTAVEKYCDIYLNDKLVMKWNKAWDQCNTVPNRDDPSLCSGATLTNEWNGNVPGGSGETEHFKAVWYPEACTEGAPLGDGRCIWGHYQVLMDQGMNADGHWVSAHATPNGFGVKP